MGVPASLLYTRRRRRRARDGILLLSLKMNQVNFSPDDGMHGIGRCPHFPSPLNNLLATIDPPPAHHLKAPSKESEREYEL